MKRQVIIAVAMLALAMGFFLVEDALTPARPAELESATTPYPLRLVSMAPSITEVVYALGLGERLVGVTRYCDYPPDAKTKASIGGFLDPNYEAIVALQPDLVVVLSVHDDVRAQLKELGIETIALEHRTLAGIRASIAELGARCGAEDAARTVLADLDARTAALEARVADRERPSVLMSAGRDLGARTLEEVYAVGPGQWLDDVIALAGGTNAVGGGNSPFPVFTAEAILRMNPDAIVELAHDLETQSFTAEDIVRDWDVLPQLIAVREKRIFVIGGDFVSIPGPRYIMIAEALARQLHPDVNWETP